MCWHPSSTCTKLFKHSLSRAIKYRPCRDTKYIINTCTVTLRSFMIWASCFYHLCGVTVKGGHPRPCLFLTTFLPLIRKTSYPIIKLIKVCECILLNLFWSRFKTKPASSNLQVVVRHTARHNYIKSIYYVCGQCIRD